MSFLWTLPRPGYSFVEIGRTDFAQRRHKRQGLWNTRALGVLCAFARDRVARVTPCSRASNPTGSETIGQHAVGTRNSELETVLSRPDPVWQALHEPPLSCRPKTRWWWYGGAVTRAEIARELETMRDAGIGGAEIQPVYPVAVDDPDNGIVNIPFFSARWYDLLGFAIEKGHELGLEVDLTLGSGWPFGGPFVQLDQAARRIRFVTREFEGPAKITWNPAAELGEGERIENITGRSLDQPVEDSVSRILSPAEVQQLASDGLEIGSGRWRLYVAIDAPTYMQVKRPTLGMEGYVIDHFAKPSLDLFLEATGERTLEELTVRRAPVFDNVFCDSLEVYGADWTPALTEEFKKRRGYDLTE
ncbi:MAG: glycosyl hydrolase, partial [Acidobacteriota bacterium]